MDLRALAEGARDLRSGDAVPVNDRHRLHIDGDYCAYYFAGNDDTDPAAATSNFESLLHMLRRMTGATYGIIHLTDGSSDKGKRYSIATVKRYQGNRDGGRKPKNWQVMRSLMENAAAAGRPVAGLRVKRWFDREADDGVAYGAGRDMAAGMVPYIYTRDKDFRMIPGIHIVWNEFDQVDLRDDPFSLEAGGLQYGRLWFWQQLLMGDPTDNVPGLPGVPKKGGGFKACGEGCAKSVLATRREDTDLAAAATVLDAYETYYGAEGRERMIEQARLLWMRRDAEADIDNWRDVLKVGEVL